MLGTLGKVIAGKWVVNTVASMDPYKTMKKYNKKKMYSKKPMMMKY